MAKSRTPLTSRPLDLFYFIFFAIHLFFVVTVDLQPLYPTWLVPGPFKRLLEYHIQTSNDPLTLGLVRQSRDFIWFKSFVFLEAIFQFPALVLGLRGLLKNLRSTYVLLLIYGVMSATTTLPCIAVILTTPLATTETVPTGSDMITSAQRLILLACYVPFFVAPLFLSLDMGSRLYRIVKASEKTKVE